MNTNTDSRIVLTLDAGGNGNLKFWAICGAQEKLLVEPIYVPTDWTANLERCLSNIVEGFCRVREHCPVPPVAISFAFPGPGADYPAGIIDKMPNMPAFPGGVARGDAGKESLASRCSSTTTATCSSTAKRSPASCRTSTAWWRRPVQSETVQEPLRRHARYRPGRRHRPRRRSGSSATIPPAARPGSWQQARPRGERRGGLQHPCGPPRVCSGGRRGRRGSPRAEGHCLTSPPFAAPGNLAAAVEGFRCLGEATGDAIAQALSMVRDGLAVVGGGISAASLCPWSTPVRWSMRSTA